MPGIHDIIVLAITGLVAGVAGGLVGIGGSIIMIPVMTLMLAVDQHVAQAAAMIVNGFVAAPAAWQHWRHKAMQPAVVARLAPAAALAAIAGVWVSEWPIFAGENQIRLARIFGGFLLYTAIFNFWRMFRPAKPLDETAVEQKKTLRTVLGVGLPTGFSGGLLGVGGGIVCIPLQQLILRTRLRHAIANSSATIVFVAVVGAIVKNLALAARGVPFSASGWLAAVLIPMGFIGGLTGGKLTHVLPRFWVRLALGIVLLAASYKLLTRKALPQDAVHEPAAAVQAATAADPLV